MLVTRDMVERRRAEVDFGCFFRRHFSRYCKRPDARIHREFDEVAMDLLLERGRMVNLIGARELGKSVRLTVALVVNAIVHQRHRYIAVQGNVRAIKDHATAITRALMMNESIRRDFGDAVAPMRDVKNQYEEFTDSALILGNDSKVLFLGPQHSIRGVHHEEDRPTLYVADDIHKGTDYDSPSTMSTTVTRVLGDSVGSLAIGEANALCLSNYAPVGSLQHALSELDGWRTVTRPIITETGEPEAGFDLDELEERRSQVGEVIWTKDYLCRPFDAALQIFDWSQFDRFDRSSISWDLDRGVRMVGADVIERTVAWLDPSRGFDKTRPRKEQRGDPDRAVIVFGGYGRSGRLYILGAEVITDSPSISATVTDRSLDAAERVVSQWRPQEFGFEDNGFQELLGRPLRERLSRYGCVVKGRTSTTNKNAMIVGLQPRLTGAKTDVSFCENNLPPEFRHEWGTMRVDGATGHDDCMDATARLIQRLRKPKANITFGPDRRLVA